MTSSEDDTTRVEAMLGCSLLDCSLLDCDEGWNKVSFPETVSSPEDSTIIVGALPGSSLLECSSSENCGSASEAESEPSRAGIRAGMWGYRVRGAMLAASVA